jgi:hypothetical protein
MKIIYSIVAFSIVALLLWLYIFESPSRRFETVSGMKLPESAKLLSFRDLFDDQDTFSNDGGLYFEFEASRDDLLELTSKKAPWTAWSNSVPYRYRRGDIPFSEIPAFHSWQVANVGNRGKLLTIDLENSKLELRTWEY